MSAVNKANQIVRDLTEDEISIFQENGWVFVKNYVDRGLVSNMLERGKELMGIGEDGRSNQKQSVKTHKNWWWDICNIAREEEVFSTVGRCSGMGRNIQRLFQRDVPILHATDAFMGKMPMSWSERSDPTGWHQDLPSFSIDRSGTMACWIALDHLTPDMGTMRFLEGSHRGGLYGRVPASDNPEVIFDSFPALREYKISATPTMEPGDATFHHCQIVHGAPANTSERIRWSYTVACMAADSAYTGASNRDTDGLGLPLAQPIRHPKFPQIWPATV